DLSYNGCSEPDRLVFRRLGLLPGPDVTAPAAAALADLDGGTAAAALDRLASAHLVEEHTPGRYALHDLVRHYAAERSAHDDPAPERATATARLHELYLATADAAA